MADNHSVHVTDLQVGMTKTDAAAQTLSNINPDVLLEVSCQTLLETQ